MRKLINPSDYIGKKFNKLTVVEYVDVRGSHRLFKVVCDCGNERVIRLDHMKKGETKSCGCYGLQKNIIHGLKGNKIYNLWKGIKRRCYNKNEKSFKNYGGRGIKICEEWKDDPMAFFNWANGRHKEGLQLDRKDNNMDYSPENCRFVTSKMNTRNTRRNLVIEYNGEKKCLSEWCELIKFNYKKVQLRIQRLKWPIEKSFNTL